MVGCFYMKRTPLRSKSLKKRVVRKMKPKGYKPPQWFMSIPYGSHGSTPDQKRFWKVTSDFVRQRDFKRFRGRCVSCHGHIGDWRDGDCGHFKKFSVCHSWFKFDHGNLALQCKKCNQREDGVVGHNFGEELKRRHGENHLTWIEKENEKYRGQKIEVWEIVERVEKLLDDNPWFVCP